MPYETKWFIRNEIILNRFWGEVTADDLRQALTETHILMDSSSRELVHIFTDVRKVTYSLKVQDSLKIIREFKREEMQGWEITVGQLDSITKFGLLISRSVLKQKAISFLTMEEAIAYLKKQDDTLTWTQADF